MKSYVTKAGVTQYKQSIKSLGRASAIGTVGFCLACGEKACGVEPDACKYECPSCGKPKVYGADELMLMGLYH